MVYLLTGAALAIIGMNEGSVRSRASGPQHGPAVAAGTGQKPD